jgi:PPM family protein phosphatase
MGFLQRLFGRPGEDDTLPKQSSKQSASQTTQPTTQQPASNDTGTPTNGVSETPTAVSAASENSSENKGTAISTPSTTPTDEDPLLYATRQLPPLESVAHRTRRRVHVGVNSDIGQLRQNNEDSLYAMHTALLSVEDMPDFGLFIVADGMGGHHDGEKASAIATRVIAQHMTSAFYLKLLSNAEERPVISEVLADAVQKANQAIFDAIPQGGTTVTAAALIGDLAYIAHVGDSRAYLITPDHIEQITRDHTLVQRLIELEQITQDEAAHHSQRNVLYRALGQNDMVEVDTVMKRLPIGGRLLLCSDGLWSFVQDSQIVQIVRGATTAQEACDKLVDAANERGGADNITTLLVHVSA